MINVQGTPCIQNILKPRQEIRKCNKNISTASPNTVLLLLFYGSVVYSSARK
jgi:hypothetical protein